jgi:protein gp37
MSASNIEWTDRVWNPVTGCTKVSQGCKHCYAEGVANRFFATQYPRVPTVDHLVTMGHSVETTRPRRFTDVMTHEDRLLEPLRWRKPVKVFVNSMSDLFHEDVPDAFIDRLFAVMALCPQQTFQVLTKRPERMHAYLAHEDVDQRVAELAMAQSCRGNFDDYDEEWTADDAWNYIPSWPLPNVWLGVSVEDQATADQRIPLLLDTPAAVRFVSYEPALGPVNFSWMLTEGWCPEHDFDGGGCSGPCRARRDRGHRIGWVIVGGESGPGARPFDVAWARSTVEQCRAAGVPVFVKQLGADPWVKTVNHFGPGVDAHPYNVRYQLKDRKGGDPAEWPEDLLVREFPSGVPTR